MSDMLYSTQDFTASWTLNPLFTFCVFVGFGAADWMLIVKGVQKLFVAFFPILE